MDDALASFLVAEGSEPPLPPEDGSGLRARTLAKIRFLRGEPSALDLWRTQSLAPQDSLELALVAEGLAIRGDSGVENVLRAIETRHPAEAFAIRAAYAWRRGDLQRATRSLEEAYRLYPRDLWALRPILSRSLGLVPKIAAMDAESGRRLLDRLSSPFPFHVLDSQRLHVVRGLSSDD
jgi:hypothetical protein